MSIANGIWLCAICSDIVDKDESTYPATLLLQWKSEAEARTLDALMNGPSASHRTTVSPTTADRIAAAKMLDEAFDQLAGGKLSDRLNWRKVDRRSLELTRRAIRDAEALDPASPMIPLMKAVRLLATGFPERAMEILNAATTSGKEIEIAQLKSRCFADLGKLADARTVLEAIVDRPGVPPAVRYNIGSAFLQEGRPDDAERWLQDAINRDPTYGEAYELLAQIARDRGDMVRAAEYSTEAFRHLPDDPQTAHDYVLTLLILERWNDAERVLGSVDSKFGQEPDFLCLKARIAVARGRLEDAEAMLRAAVAIAPAHAVSLHNLGYLQLMQGRFDEAQHRFEQAKRAGYPEEEDIPGRIAALRAKWESSRS